MSAQLCLSGNRTWFFVGGKFGGKALLSWKYEVWSLKPRFWRCWVVYSHMWTCVRWIFTVKYILEMTYEALHINGVIRKERGEDFFHWPKIYPSSKGRACTHAAFDSKRKPDVAIFKWTLELSLPNPNLLFTGWLHSSRSHFWQQHSPYIIQTETIRHGSELVQHQRN